MNLVHVWKDNRRRTEILEVFLIVFLICFVLLKNLDQLNGIGLQEHILPVWTGVK